MWLSSVFFQIIFVFSFSSGQDITDMKLDSVLEILEHVRKFDSKLQDLQNDLSVIKDSQDVLQKAFSEQQDYQSGFGNNTCGRGELTELQNSMQMEFQSSKEQLATLQELITTETDECSRGIDDCDSHGQCVNTIGSYTCMCQEGFSVDGFNCKDVDECSKDIDDCDTHGVCVNTIGSYTCTCPEGFLGDGFNCEVHDCEAPFLKIESIGCIFKSSVEMSFDYARTNCLARSADLWIANNFTEIQKVTSLVAGSHWVAIRNRAWFDGRMVTPDEWGTNNPNQHVNACGYLRQDNGAVRVHDAASCNNNGFYLCHKKT